ncbi:MAG: hypothetical protein ACRDNZ_14265, partial [Streptosporangiaceae bacterium]
DSGAADSGAGEAAPGQVRPAAASRRDLGRIPVPRQAERQLRDRIGGRTGDRAGSAPRRRV